MAWISDEKKLKEIAKKVQAVASPEQLKIFKDFEAGDERLFLNRIKEPITFESIDKTLEIIVNTVEGDTSQLSEELAKYAKIKGWLKGFK